MSHNITCTGLSPYIAALSSTFHFYYFDNNVVLLPRWCRNINGLGCSPVARHYWGNHVCFLLLQVLRCFSSLRLPTLRYNTSSMYWVIPFGNPRVNGYLHLYAAYRSLSRPSSPLRAKASTIRPCLFTLIHAYSLFTVFRLLLISLLVVHTYICTICCGLYSNRFFPKCQRTAYHNGTGWRIRESNPWPPACKAGALANWANPPGVVPRGVEPRTSTLSV